MTRLIFHLDMDQFFAAVELRHHPHLRGKPVIIGGSPSGRGIVTTCTYEARRFGVRSGMPASDAIRLCPQAIFVRPNGDKYIDVSRRIFALLREFTDRVEPVSVDEAYMDMTDVVWKEHGVEALAMKIKQRIKEREEITATIGAGANRLVAKVASGMQKPDGFTYLPPERVAAVFQNMPVGDLYGVGRVTQRTLEAFGIRTAGQLAAFPVEVLRRRMGKFGEELVRIARGEGDDTVAMPHEHAQERSMGHEHTFGQNYSDEAILLGRLNLLCEKVARRLRAAGLAGKVVNVKIRYKGFETVLHGHKLKQYVQHEMYIYPVVEKLFHESYRAGEPVRLIGVHLAGLMSTEEILQQELFAPPDTPSLLGDACDSIKQRFGEDAIGFASGTFLNGSRTRSQKKTFNPFFTNLLRA
ncbi:MAG TPA: DNA polymerase IV [bacterium]|jgi:nucleotidyltransferase/DNA polymerase involved in DNA repair